MPEEISLFEAIYTQRAIRRFKPDPVPDDLVRRLIESATKAPSGSNQQPWSFIIIRDSDTRRRISEYYRRSWEAVFGSGPDTRSSLAPRIRASAEGLAEHMHEVPVLILACIRDSGASNSITTGSSIYPAVQNLLLAAKGLGLGSVLTTLHKRYDAEIKELLGIPDGVETAALLPVGYPTDDTQYGPTRRRPVEEVTYRDRWGSIA